MKSNGGRVGIGYQVFQTRVKLTGTLTLLSGLHIGQGRALEPAASELPVLKDWGGQPFVPGSALKGVLRSNLEAWLRALFPTAWWQIACNRIGKHSGVHLCTDRREGRYVYFDHEGRARDLEGDEIDAQLWEHSCWTCRLFGSPWIASKSQVLDLPVVGEWLPERLMVRDGVAIDRESETAAPKLKYDFEVVPAGTTFRLELLVDNPEPWEMGLLMVGFDLLNEGYALLGGNSSRGLGRVRVDWEEILTVTPNQLLEGLEVEEAEAGPAETEEAQSSGSETEEEEQNDPLRAVVTCLRKLGGSAERETLIAAMQQRGWTKQRLQEAFEEKKGFNWKQLFERAVKEQRIVFQEGRYVLPEIQAVAAQADETVETVAEEARHRREAIEQQVRDWKRALKQKIQETREGK